MSKDILDIDGAAELLGISKTTAYKLVQDGMLPGMKIGKEWRFAKKNLIKWVADSGKNSEPDSLEELLKNSPVRPASRE